MPQETTSGAELSQDIRSKLVNERQLLGFSVDKLPKTGSGLQVLSRPEMPVLIRHTEIPVSSLAVWEYLETYIKQLFPADVNQRLFGEWQSPQVAPILKKDGQNRVKYGHEKGRAYSQMVGVNSTELGRQLGGLDKEYAKFSSYDFRRSLWHQASTYFFTQSVFREVPDIIQNSPIQQLIEDYWEEFGAINKRFYGSEEALKEKRIEENDAQASGFLSSIKLIEIGHRINRELVRIFQESENTPNPACEYRGRSVSDVLLFLIHLHQTSVQEDILWWLGISHGHLHHGNTVSYATMPGTPEAQVSPLKTSIIDFDQSRIQALLIGYNQEIESLVDVHHLTEFIQDETINQNVRLLLTFILPITEWDDPVFAFVESTPTTEAVVRELTKAITIKAKRSDLSERQYNRFADLLLSLERGEYQCYYNSPAASSLIRFLIAHPDWVHSSSPDIQLIAGGLTEHNLPGIEDLDVKDKTLLASTLYIKSLEMDRLSTEDLKAVIALLNIGDREQQSDQVSNLGMLLSSFMFSILNYHQDSVIDLVKSSRAGDVEATALLQKLTVYCFREVMTHAYLTAFIEKDVAEYAVDQIFDFHSHPDEFGWSMYLSYRESVTDYMSDLDRETKEAIVQRMDTKAAQTFGRFKVAKLQLSLISEGEEK